MPPMFLADKSPHMLPAQTLNVTVGGATSTGNSNAKRDVVGGFEITEPLNKNPFMTRRIPINTERWWWVGVIMASIGGAVLIYN